MDKQYNKRFYRIYNKHNSNLQPYLTHKSNILKSKIATFIVNLL